MLTLMGFRHARIIEPELLDHQPQERAVRSLRDLVRINRLTGGHRVLQHALRACVRPREKFAFLDIGAASGDAARLVGEIYPNAFVTSLDYRGEHLSFASGHRVIGDAFRLPLRPKSFDIVYCGLFLHHFRDEQVVQLLRCFSEVARRYVIANDLERHVLPFWFLPATRWLFHWDRITLHDGPVSVQAGFTQTELEHLARTADLRNPAVWRFRPAFRLCLIAQPMPVPGVQPG